MKKINLFLNMMILLVALSVIALNFPVRSVFKNISYDAFHKMAPRVYEPAPAHISDNDDQSRQK